MSANVSVKLTAEGEAQVVAAFRKVSAEALAASKKSNAGFASLAGGVSSLKAGLAGLFATIGFGAIAGFAKAGGDAADAMGKLAQKVGDTTENVSALSAAAATADVGPEALQKSLARLDTVLRDLRAGAPDAEKKLGDLGFTLEDFDGKGTAEAFALIAKRVGELKDSGQKTALVMALFGDKLGSQLIPLLNDLSEKGLEGARAAAERLGVLFDDKLAAAAQTVNDDFATLQLQTKGLGAQFTAGLAPAIHSTFQVLSEEIGAGGKNFQIFGHIVGIALEGVLTLVALLVDAVFTLAATVVKTVGTIGVSVKKALIDLDFKAAGEQFAKGFQGIGGDLASFGKRVARAATIGVESNLPKTPRSGAQTDDAEDAEGIGAAKAAIKKREQLLKASLDREQQIRELRARLANEADKRAYETGLIDVQEYYRRRAEIIEKSADAELASLRRQRAELETDSGSLEKRSARIRSEIAKLTATATPATTPSGAKTFTFGGGRSRGGAGGGGSFEPPAAGDLKALDTAARLEALKSELEKTKKLREEADSDVAEKRRELDAKIQRIETEREGAIAALERDHADEDKKLGDARVAIEAKIKAAEGDRHAQAMADIDEEVGRAELTLKQSGVPHLEAAAQTDELRRVLEAGAEFDKQMSDANVALAGLDNERARIQGDVAFGHITELQAESQIIAAERERLKTLQDIADKALEAAKATGDEDKVKQAEALAVSIRHIGESVIDATNAMGRLRQAFESGLSRGLFHFLTDGVKEFHSFGEAARDLALTVVESMQAVVAQILTTLAVKQLEKALGFPFSAGGLVGGEQGFAKGGKVGSSSSPREPGFAAGGRVGSWPAASGFSTITQGRKSGTPAPARAIDEELVRRSEAYLERARILASSSRIRSSEASSTAAASRTSSSSAARRILELVVSKVVRRAETYLEISRSSSSSDASASASRTSSTVTGRRILERIAEAIVRRGEAYLESSRAAEMSRSSDISSSEASSTAAASTSSRTASSSTARRIFERIASTVTGRRSDAATAVPGGPQGPPPSEPGFAAGGLLRGPGGSTSDSIRKTVPPGTYIVRAAAVRARGVLEHLSGLLAGRPAADASSSSSTARSRTVSTAVGIPVRLSAGEFEMPPAIVRRRGMLEHLDRVNRFGSVAIEELRGFNAGGVVERIVPGGLGGDIADGIGPAGSWRLEPIVIERAAGLAGGGIATAAPAAAAGSSSRVDGEIRVGLNRESAELLILDVLGSAKGQKVQLTNVTQTRRAHRAIIG